MSVVPLLPVVGACLLCAGCAALTIALLPALTRGLRLERTNYAGHSIRTGYGLAIWLPAALSLAWLGERGQPLCDEAAAALVIFGLLGLADDLWGDRSVGGFRGHLGCWIEKRRITTGLFKLVVGGMTALALGLWLTSSTGWSPRRFLGMLSGAAVIALSANTFNLFDLRPLRTLKLFAVGCALLGGASLMMARSSAPLPVPPPGWPGVPNCQFAVAAVVGELLSPAAVACLLYAPLEARRLAMLGDTGANALGALWGVAACVALPPSGRLVLAAFLAALNWYSERHSITRLIQSHPLLDRLDRWGASC